MNVKDSKKGQAIPSYVEHIGKEAFDRPEATEIRKRLTDRRQRRFAGCPAVPR